MSRWITHFDQGSAGDRDLLGGKGANLCEMTRMGLPVPPGFIVGTDACRAHLADPLHGASGLREQIVAAVHILEEQRGKLLGDPSSPLLLSVRSGAKFSMPGMMDTVLDLGLNPATVKGLAKEVGDDRFAADSWRRFTEMFGRVVLGVPDDVFSQVRHDNAPLRGLTDPAELDAAGAESLVLAYRAAIEAHTNQPFPDDPWEQLAMSVEAVFGSWMGRRAIDYRRHEGIADDLGTAVTVQAMVFGNLGSDSGSGVVFTRNPATGQRQPYGDFLRGAQGEDVVSGVRVTEPFEALADHFPEAHLDLVGVLAQLEARYQDMCDVEFTVESGRLWVLQTRVGKRSAAAAVRIAVEIADQGLVTRPEAVLRVSPSQLERLLHPTFAPEAHRDVLTVGLAASPGAASGEVCFTADDAEARTAEGHDVLLVRTETSPEDLHGLLAAKGVLTSRGGLVSHAAVVARSIGRPAVCGADALEIDVRARRIVIGDVIIAEGDVLSIDGTTGEVVLGEVAVVTPKPPAELERLLGWADDMRDLGIRANADTATDAQRARSLGAEGIGLCRTEHQFLGDRLPLLQRVILATDDEERAAALAPLHEAQLKDFTELLQAMDGLPVTVRLLDPPLHEFLPDLHDLRVADATGALDEQGTALLAAAEHWGEHNPMLGIRGVRLGVLLPELYRVQVRALVSAACAVRSKGGHPHVQVMIPLVIGPEELAYAIAEVRDEIRSTLAALGAAPLDVRVGTMIETPRAALLAEAIAPLIDFCSFGTNDLTQMTFGFSRDDVEARLLPRYLALGLLPDDPFATIDVDGVGHLVRMALTQGRDAAPGVEFGVCGEHGGDPRSIAFFHDVGLDYVSCSPFRIPVARLAAAHAAS